MKELEKTYDPSQIEDRLYRKWEEKKYFHAEVDRSKKLSVISNRNHRKCAKNITLFRTILTNNMFHA